MKKIVKLCLLFVLIIMTAGCSGNYNLKINKDLSIDESLELSINNNNDAYNKTLKIFEENNIEKDNYEVKIKEDEVIINYKEKFISIEDYILNSKIYPQLFEKIGYNKTKNDIDLYTDQKIKFKNKYTEINGNNLTDFDVIQVNIENPFNVELSNEDIVNDNIYTWSLTKDNPNKIIKMKFKTSFNRFPYKSVIIGLLIAILTIAFTYNVIKKYRNLQKI